MKDSFNKFLKWYEEGMGAFGLKGALLLVNAVFTIACLFALACLMLVVVIKYLGGVVLLSIPLTVCILYFYDTMEKTDNE